MKKLALLLVVALALFSFVGCAKEQPAGNSGETKTVTGSAEGFGGEVKVTVTVTNGKITDVQAVGDDETPGIGGEAIKVLPGKIVEAGKADVDGYAGATFTSNAIKEAVNKALEGK